MKRLLVFGLLIFLSMNVLAVRDKDVFGTRVFIENKGQFDKHLPTQDKVKFGIENGNENIYFTPKGLTYVLVKRFEPTQEEIEEQEKRMVSYRKPNQIYYVNMNWVNCNSNIQIIESEKQSHYFTYGGPELNAHCFKKITYLNVYNKIDIEYIIPDDKEAGIKYNVILHPGADPSQVKIAYTGDVNGISLDENGNVRIGTPMEPIIEYKPVSTQDGRDIKTNFTIKKKNIEFSIQGDYDTSKDLVIDPFVVNITTFNGSGYGYDVDFDNFGNLFVYGGTTNSVAKYNSLGVLQWTFPGSMAAPPWSSSIAAAYNFVVHRFSGKVYVGKSLTATIIRLDPFGNYDNLMSNNVASWSEIWDMAYHCATDKIYGLGGSIYSNECSGIMDQVTGTIVPIVFFGPTATQGHDVASHTIDNSGEIYFLFASVQTTYLNNMITKINSAFTSSVWIAPTNFSTFSEAGNKSFYVGGAVTSNGFNALASNNNFLFYWDGFNLAAYNKVTGNMITATTVAGLNLKEQGGIAVDDCNNVYIGGNGNILSYKYTGSSFVALPSINANATTVNKYVYDIKLDKGNKVLYVSGSGFCGTYSAINSITCALAPDCNYNIPATNTAICFGQVAAISIGNPNNLTSPSYSIQPGATIQSSNTFTVAPTVTTNYTLYITGLNSTSVLTTNTTIATVTVFPAPFTNTVLTNGTCANPVTSSVNLNITFNPSGSPNYTTTWSPMPSTVTTVNSGTAAGLVPGINNVTVTTANGCTTAVSFVVPPIPQQASFVVVNPSGDYTVTCLNPNVVLTTSITNGVPLTFTWFPVCTNSLVGTTMSFNQACTGQVVGTSSTGCQYAQTYTVYQNLQSPTIVITPTVNNITCAGGSGCFTLTSNLGPNVTTNWFQVSGSNTVYVGAAQGTINIFCPGQPGVYWGESVYNITGCKATKSVQVTASVGVPIFTVTSPTNFTIGCASKSITSMQVTTVITSPVPNVPVNYTFMIPPVTGTPTTFTTNPNLNNITIPGTYVIYVKDLTNNCVSSQSISIIQNTIAPNIDFIQPLSILSCRDPSMVLNGISSNTNTQISWTVPAIPSNSVNPTPNNTVTINPAVTNSSNNITAVGIYTVGAVDQNNMCSSSKTVQILQDIRLPKFTISALTNSIINCKNADVVIVPIVTPTLAVALVPTYIWYPPVGQGVPGTQFNTTSAGTHTSISMSVVNGCTYSATYIVASDFVPPALNVSPAFTLDCATNPTVTLTPSITGSSAGFTYSWTVPAGALTSALTGSALTTNYTGGYMVVVTNTLNGCVNQAFYQVVEGGIKASFNAIPNYGVAPLNVTFNNTSSTSTGATSIISTWGYGNGAVTQTVYNTQPTSATYTAAGTYIVYLQVKKGLCIDTAMRTVIVDLPSKLEVPNVFTPNGDKSNDIFRLRATNLSELYIIIYDRWGTKVYELTSETGNFAWDGKAQTGKECAAGVYFYIIKGTGKDGQVYDLRGNVSLFR